MILKAYKNKVLLQLMILIKRNTLGRREMNDVEMKRRGDMCLTQDLLDGIRLKRRRPRLEEGLVCVECSSWRQRCFRGLDRVADGFCDGRDHLGVEHERRWCVLEGLHGEGDVLGGDGRKFVNLCESVVIVTHFRPYVHLTRSRNP